MKCYIACWGGIVCATVNNVAGNKEWAIVWLVIAGVAGLLSALISAKDT